jgi:shikimate kinase
MNVILIGMPGCGKSTIGVVLAKTLNHSFIDADLLIQDQTGKRLQEIIDTEGLARFGEIEEEVLSGIRCENTVVATGGSAIYYPAAMKHLKELGIVVYIRLSCEKVKKRLGNLETRGIAGAKDKTIDQLYAERIPYYEQYADFIVDCDEGTLAENMEKIAHQIELALLE